MIFSKYYISDLSHIILYDMCAYHIRGFDMIKKNQSITAMISEREVRIIDRLVENGYYCSRSDAVRAFVRYGISLAENNKVIIE